MNDETVQLFQKTLDTMYSEIKQTDQKAQKAMRVTLWLKLIVAIVSIGALSSWLKDHGHKEIYAGILLFGELADVLLDNLPYFQQRVTLPQMKLKLVHLQLDLEQTLSDYSNGLIENEEAIKRFYAIRKAWIKSLS